MTSQPAITIDTATSADELLTALASIKPEYRSLALGGRGLKILRAAADLCGVDSAAMGKASCIHAIIENF
jgi:hypothetical protein